MKKTDFIKEMKNGNAVITVFGLMDEEIITNEFGITPEKTGLPFFRADEKGNLGFFATGSVYVDYMLDVDEYMSLR